MSAEPTLRPGLVWRTCRFGEHTAEDWRLLSPDERTRAAAIGHHAARTRFIVGRSLLRRTIRGYLPAIGTQGPAIVVAPSGRPYLAGLPDVHVSLSHMDGTAAAVVSLGPVGIDVEASGRDDLPPIRRWLTVDERRLLDVLAPPARLERLLALWVAKEAALKAWDHLGPADRRSIELRDGPDSASMTAVGPNATAHLLIRGLHGAYLMAIATHVRPFPPACRGGSGALYAPLPPRRHPSR